MVPWAPISLFFVTKSCGLPVGYLLASTCWHLLAPLYSVNWSKHVEHQNLARFVTPAVTLSSSDHGERPFCKGKSSYPEAHIQFHLW